MKKRIVSLLMALALCLSLLPTSALAETVEELPPRETIQQQDEATEPAQQDEEAEDEAEGNSEEENEEESEEENEEESEEETKEEAEDETKEETKTEGEPMFTMQMAVAPLAAANAEHSDHPICGATCKHKSGDTSEHDSVTWTGVDKLSDVKADEDGNPKYYYLTKPVTLSNKWFAPNGVTLCLNGHSITSTASNVSVIDVSSGTFTLCDCQNTGTITHTGTTGRGMYVGEGGTFNMYGGSITGNTAQDSQGRGGGVCVNGGGIFKMFGGSITGNKATDGGGVYAEKNSIFYMYGGSITGNNADSNGGGVYKAGGFYVCGGAQIKDNVKGGTKSSNGKYTGGTANNVYIPVYHVICIGDTLTEGSKIGVTLDSNFGESAFTSGWSNYMGDKTPSDYFTSDADGYAAKLNGSELKMVNTHVHRWTYTAKGATITATCGDCNASGGSVTISAPTELVYSGSGKAATLENTVAGLADPDIAYKQGNETLRAAPTNVGTYTASITLGSATASVTYTITKATPTVSGTGTASGTYGQRLSEVTINTDGLTVTLNGRPVEGSWAWKAGQGETLNKVNTVVYTAVFTPNDTANLDTAEATVTMTIAPKEGRTLYTEDLTQKYTDRVTRTYTPNWEGLPEGENWEYSCASTTIFGSITVENLRFTANDGKTLTYKISSGQAGDTVIFILTATCHSRNYTPFTITVKVTLTDKDTPIVTANNISVPYTGEEIPASAITGTATFGNASVAGTWSWNGTAPKNVADSGPRTVVFEPTDSANYATAEATITVTINQATPTGAPKYTKITTSGKTLSDAGLTLEGSTLNPNAGTLEWLDEDGNVLSDTTVVEKNTVYTWRFTPTDTNYQALTDTVELYHVSNSSGSYYYKHPTASGTTDTKKSPGTGDAGLLVYGLTALTSYTGTALVLRRRKRED